jgi:hypothetical protein
MNPIGEKFHCMHKDLKRIHILEGINIVKDTKLPIREGKRKDIMR